MASKRRRRSVAIGPVRRCSHVDWGPRALGHGGTWSTELPGGFDGRNAEVAFVLRQLERREVDVPALADALSRRQPPNLSPRPSDHPPPAVRSAAVCD